MNASRALMTLVFLSLPFTAGARNLEPCNKSHLYYRNLESQAITKVPASYPNEPGVRVKGKVVVLIKVDRHGNVIYAHVICGHALLAASSVAAAMRWKFQPRRVNGRPAKNVGIITFHFSPDGAYSEYGSAKLLVKMKPRVVCALVMKRIDQRKLLG